MMKPATVIKWVIVLLIGLATASSACAGSQNYIEVKNDWSHSMWAIFKCYTNQPWESNTCRYENTYIFIKPGKSHKWSYTYTKGMGCQKINLRYGRADRSCDGCDKRIDLTFSENEAKRFRIIGQGSGDLGFGIEPIHGTYIE